MFYWPGATAQNRGRNNQAGMFVLAPPEQNNLNGMEFLLFCHIGAFYGCTCAHYTPHLRTPHSPTGHVFPAGYSSLCSSHWTYLLALQDNSNAAMCAYAVDVAVPGLTAGEVARVYGDSMNGGTGGILCGKGSTLRRVAVWSRGHFALQVLVCCVLVYVCEFTLLALAYTDV